MTFKKEEMIATHPKNVPLQIREFHVVGGGCFGSQYVGWLERARALGWLQLEKIRAIDHDPNCLLATKQESYFEWVRQDWVTYLSDYLVENFQNSIAQGDHWVPSPLSPHILFLGFLSAARRIMGSGKFEELPFREGVPPPIKMPLKPGTLAVSFAEWKCPVNCIEPSNCPAIHQPRTWDMQRDLSSFFSAQHSERSAHILQCRHLVHGVGTIPCELIFSEFRRLLDELKARPSHELLVATVSGCHGVIGRAAWQA